MICEGEKANNTGDTEHLYIKNNNNTYDNIIHPVTKTKDNFFHGCIYIEGEEANDRNPKMDNNYGMDILSFNLDNSNKKYIQNNQRNLSLKFDTKYDYYGVFCIGMSIDSHKKNLLATASYSGNSPINAGENAEFTINLFNKSTEEIKNAEIRIPLPSNTTLVSNVSNGFTLNSKTSEYPNGYITWKGSVPKNNGNNSQPNKTLKYTLQTQVSCLSGSYTIEAKGSVIVTDDNTNTISSIVSEEAIKNDNCEKITTSGKSNKVTINNSGKTIPVSDIRVSYCPTANNEYINVSSLITGGSTIELYDENKNKINTNQQINKKQIATFTKVFYYKKNENGCTTNFGKIEIKIEDNQKPNLTVPSDLVLVCDQANANNLINNWLAQAKATDNCSAVSIKNNYSEIFKCKTQEKEIEFCAEDAFGNKTCKTSKIIIQKFMPGTCELKYYNFFSPNGDGVNDTFIIEGVQCYDENNFKLYNRWGKLVFEIDNYNNNDRVFKGFGSNSNEKLPSGVYFYIFKYDKEKQNTGWVFF